MHKLLEE